MPPNEEYPLQVGVEEIDSFNVAEWIADGDKDPSSVQIEIIGNFTVKTSDTILQGQGARFVINFQSAAIIDQLVNALQKHRFGVWG
jgi:hypothetical protein